MEPESLADFAMRIHGMGNADVQNPPESKNKALNYILNAAGIAKEDLERGLLTNEPTQNWRQSIIRGTPSGIGATIGAPIGFLGMGLGGIAGESVRQAAAQAYSATTNKPTASPGQVLGSVAKEGAIQAIAPVVAKPLFKFAGKTITGISDAAMTRLMDRPDKVASLASMDPEAAPALAKTFVDAIKNNMERAGEAYRKLINKAVGNKGIVINLKDSLFDEIGEIRKDFGYGLPGRLAEEREQKTFSKFANATIDMVKSTPEQAYYFQRDLNNAIMSNPGRPVAVALKRLRDKTMEALSNSLPEIKAANKIYSSASSLSDDLSRVTNADSALGVIKSALKNKGNTYDALMDATKQLSGGRKLLEAIEDAMAGKEFEPLLANLPRTGLTAGLGALGLKAAEGASMGPQYTAGAALIAPFLSPRTIAYGARGIMSMPGQLATRSSLSAAVNELTDNRTTSTAEPENLTDFIMRIHGVPK